MLDLDRALPTLDRLAATSPTPQVARETLSCLSDLGSVVQNRDEYGPLADQVGRARYLADSMLDLYDEVTTIDLSRQRTVDPDGPTQLPSGPAGRSQEAIAVLWDELRGDLARIRQALSAPDVDPNLRERQQENDDLRHALAVAADAAESALLRAERAERDLAALRSQVNALATGPAPTALARRDRRGYQHAQEDLRDILHGLRDRPST